MLQSQLMVLRMPRRPARMNIPRQKSRRWSLETWGTIRRSNPLARTMMIRNMLTNPCCAGSHFHPCELSFAKPNRYGRKTGTTVFRHGLTSFAYFQRYVAKFDHFCAITNTPIGEKNHCLFWWLLFFQASSRAAFTHDPSRLTSSLAPDVHSPPGSHYC